MSAGAVQLRRGGGQAGREGTPGWEAGRRSPQALLAGHDYRCILGDLRLQQQEGEVSGITSTVGPTTQGISNRCTAALDPHTPAMIAASTHPLFIAQHTTHQRQLKGRNN